MNKNKVPVDLLRRVKRIEDVLNVDDNYIDLGALLDKPLDEIIAWLEDNERAIAARKGAEALRQGELRIEERRMLLNERREREALFAHMEALGISNRQWFENQAEVEERLMEASAAS